MVIQPHLQLRDLSRIEEDSIRMPRIVIWAILGAIIGVVVTFIAQRYSRR